MVGVSVRRMWPAGSIPLMDKQGKEIAPGHVARKPGRALKSRWGFLKTSMLSPHPRWTEVHTRGEARTQDSVKCALGTRAARPGPRM